MIRNAIAAGMIGISSFAWADQTATETTQTPPPSEMPAPAATPAATPATEATPAATPAPESAPPAATSPAAAPPPVASGVNLVPNGDFEQLAGNQASHWESPAAPGVSVLSEAAPHVHFLRLSASDAEAKTSGIKFLSEPVQAEVGRSYGIKLDARSSGISAIVWVRGYGDFDGQERELYNYKKEIQFEKPDAWTAFESYFTVREPVGAAALARRGKAVPIPTRMRVELFCFGGGAGHVDFDNVSIIAREAPAPTPAPTPLPTPYQTPAATPAPTPEATPAATPEATPAATPPPAPEQK